MFSGLTAGDLQKPKYTYFRKKYFRLFYTVKVEYTQKF